MHSTNSEIKTPICLITIGIKINLTLISGMAGAGKTSFMQRLNAEIKIKKQKQYVMNLDPAVTQLPYG